MAIDYPQFELPRGLSGGADLWDDDGAAGQILRADFFTQAFNARVSWAEIEIPAASGAVAKTATSSLSAAVRAALGATASLGAAVRNPGAATVTVGAAIRATSQAQVSTGAAVRAAQQKTASVLPRGMAAWSLSAG